MATEIMREIRSLIVEHTNRHVTEWKEAGRPVVGYFCPYVPAEIIVAVGALPLRLRGAGNDDSSHGDAYLSGRICTYVRHVMSLVLDDRFDFLDGQVNTNSCDHVRRAADLFKKKTSVPFVGFISVPRAPEERNFEYYRREVQRLYNNMAEHFGVEASDDALRQAIETQNASRRVLLEIDELRRSDRPQLTGAEALAIHIASQVLPPGVFVELGQELLGLLRQRPGCEPPRARLLLLGAELDEPEYVEAIESQGAIVVADQLCFGARSVLAPIEPRANGAEVDPLTAIARAHFFRPSCARMIGAFPQRWRSIEQLMTEARADGVIFQRLLFCDPWGGELHNLKSRLDEKPSFPLLSLNREYGIVPTGQVKTRVQAFIERLEIDRTRRVPRAGAQTAGGGA